MLRPATSSSSLPQQRPRACGGRTAARLAPFRHHAAGSSAARPFSTPLPSIKAAPRPRIAVIPGGGPDSGRALGHSPFGPAQASFPSPAPAKNYLNQELTSNGPPGVSAASLPPRSSAGEQLSPHSFPRGTPQQIAEEVEAVRKLYPGGFSGLVNLPKFPGNLSEITRSRPKFNTAGRSATALAVGEDVLTESSGSGSGGAAGQRPASPDTSAPDASAVAAARLLRGALEAALLPRLEALEGRIVEAVEGRVVQRMMDMEQQREEVVGARERQLTAALEAMAAVMREQGKGKGEKGEGQELEQGKGQQVLGQGKEQWEQGQQAEGQGEEKGEEQGQRNEGHGQDQQGQEQEQQGEGQGQGQADHEQPLVDALAAQEQRIREELKVMWARLWGGSACAWGRSNRVQSGAMAGEAYRWLASGLWASMETVGELRMHKCSCVHVWACLRVPELLFVFHPDAIAGTSWHPHLTLWGMQGRRKGFAFHVHRRRLSLYIPSLFYAFNTYWCAKQCAGFC